MTAGLSTAVRSTIGTGSGIVNARKTMWKTLANVTSHQFSQVYLYGAVVYAVLIGYLLDLQGAHGHFLYYVLAAACFRSCMAYADTARPLPDLWAAWAMLPGLPVVAPKLADRG